MPSWTSPISTFTWPDPKHLKNKSWAVLQYSSPLCKINVNALYQILLSTLVSGSRKYFSMGVLQSSKSASTLLELKTGWLSAFLDKLAWPAERVGLADPGKLACTQNNQFYCIGFCLIKKITPTDVKAICLLSQHVSLKILMLQNMPNSKFGKRSNNIKAHIKISIEWSI